MKKIITLLLSLPVICFAAPIEDNNALMNRAVDAFFKTYREAGMLGAANEIGNCYKSRKKDKLYCLYFDYTARIFDARMSEAMNFPATEFFDDERFAERTISKVYLPRDVSMDEANQHLSELYGKLTQKISVKIYTSVQ